MSTGVASQIHQLHNNNVLPYRRLRRIQQVLRKWRRASLRMASPKTNLPRSN
jgi:hypothetical protein